MPSLDAARATLGFVSAFFERDRLHVLTSGDPVRTAGALAAGAAGDSRVEVAQVPYSLAQLKAVRDDIIANVRPTPADSDGITMVGIDVTTGRVKVGVTSLDSPFSHSINARYGDIVALSEGPLGELYACSSRDNCGTKGGLRAYLNGWSCSTGFLIRESSGSIGMLTAGHCIQQSGGNNAGNWRNSGATWGSGNGYAFCDGCSFDTGKFRLPSPPSTKNEYYADGMGDIRSIGGTISENGMVWGRLLCRGGLISQWGCGPITSEDVAVNWGTLNNPKYTLHSWVVRLKSTEGDSGSGFVNTSAGVNYAAGILFGGIRAIDGNDYTWLSTVQRSGNFWQYQVCTSASC
ncbi:MAG: hypothetical protein Q8N51_10325 [Gammaproteobacteria bacterium]|nr:hypothetical protein [Gammaproteobacteria bacterium]